MFLEICLAILAGVTFGIFTGLIPGIHINLVSLFVLTYSYFLLKYFSLNFILVFIVTMSLVHTFIDFIPSIIFGIPDSDTALSVLPAHKLAIEGKAKLAIYLSSLGSLFGVFASIMLMPLMFIFLESLYEIIKIVIPYILFFVICFLIFIEKNIKSKIIAFVVVIFAGGVGVLVLNSYQLDQSLFLLFTGLFGISNLFFSLKDNTLRFPKQKKKFKYKINKKNFLSGLSLSCVAATFCSIFPGLGNAQAGVLSTFFMKLKSSELMIFVFGAINTINFAVSVFTFYLIERTRNGSIYVLSQIVDNVSFEKILFYLILLIFVGILAFCLTIFIGKIILKFIEKINIRMMNLFLIFALYLIGFYFSGITGILVLHMCAMLGLFALLNGVSRYHLMSVLIVPIFFNLI